MINQNEAVGSIMKTSTKVEALMRELGGQGKGMKSLLDSLSDQLDDATTGAIKQVMYIRNEHAHQDVLISQATYDRFVDRSSFVIGRLQSNIESMAKDGGWTATGPDAASFPAPTAAGNVEAPISIPGKITLLTKDQRKSLSLRTGKDKLGAAGKKSESEPVSGKKALKDLAIYSAIAVVVSSIFK